MSKHFLDITIANQTSEKIKEDDLVDHLEEMVSRLSPDKDLSNLGASLQSPGATGKLGIEIVFVGDQEIKRLNKQYRSNDSVTDVLSFETGKQSSLNDDSTNLFGSIVVSVDTAGRQAKEAGIELMSELKTLTGHGLLHLFGFHHN